MFELFYMGGPLFMGMLTLIFLVMLVVMVRTGLPVISGAGGEESLRKIGYIKAVGLFAFVVGVLGQLIGLYDAFKAIEQMGAISPAILAGGLKVSMITTLYGLLIYVIGYLVWLGLVTRSKT